MFFTAGYFWIVCKRMLKNDVRNEKKHSKLNVYATLYLAIVLFSFFMTTAVTFANNANTIFKLLTFILSFIIAALIYEFKKSQPT